MGLIVFLSPGTQLTQAEYEGHFTTIYDEFNGSIDNNNIKSAAGIVDTKLATIQTTGKVMETALPVGYTGAKTFSGGISVSNAGGGGMTVADGVTVSSGGISITLGGMVIGAGGLNLSGGLTIADIGVVVNAGGIDINAGGMTVAGGVVVEDVGLTVAAGGVTVSSGDVVVNGGNISVAAGATVDGVDLSAHDTASTGVHGVGANMIIDSSHDVATGVHGVGGSSVASLLDISNHDISNNIHGVPNAAGTSVCAVLKGVMSSIFLNFGWRTVTVAIPPSFGAGAGAMLQGIFYSPSTPGEEVEVRSVLLSPTQTLTANGLFTHNANEIIIRVNAIVTLGDYELHYQLTK